MKFLNIIMNILALSSLVITFACTEDEEHGSNVRTINALIMRPDTRTALDGPDANGVYKTVWASGDEIMVFSGTVANSFKLKSGESTNAGVFEGSADSDDLVAVYPLSIGQSNTGSTIIVDLPEVQKYENGNIPADAYPMLGTYSDETLSFNNLCSVLKVSMSGNATIKSIAFSPNNASVKASGKATIDISSKTLNMADDANPSVRLSCPDIVLTSTPIDFHLVVPAQNYPEGFTLTITTDKEEIVKTLKSDITLSRSVLYPIDAFEYNDGDSAPTLTTAIIMTNNGSTEIALKEGSTLLFSNDCLIIKTFGKETKVALRDLTHLSYK